MPLSAQFKSGEAEMSMYAKVSGQSVLKYPYTFEDLQAENPYTKFPDSVDLAALYEGTEDQIATGARIVAVQTAPVPVCDANRQRLVPHTLPAEYAGIWTISCDVVDLPSNEVLANTQSIGAVVQAKIDAVLSETAWTVEPNSGLPPDKVQEWATYRTVLAAVSQQPGFPFEYTLPVKPT